MSTQREERFEPIYRFDRHTAEYRESSSRSRTRCTGSVPSHGQTSTTAIGWLPGPMRYSSSRDAHTSPTTMMYTTNTVVTKESRSRP